MLAYSLFERHDGYAFAYKVLGRNQRATPLVLVHGLSAVGLVDWLPLAQSLAEHRSVLIFDNRGIGASTVPRERADEPYDVRDMARDVVELVNHLGWKEIDLLGFSMGGMIAQTVLVSPSLPFKICHVVLAATSAKPAHSDLLQAIPSPPPGPMSYEQKVELVKPFIYVGYDPAFVQNPQNKQLLDRRIRESVETRRPARTVQHQIGVIAGYDVRKQLPSVPKSLPVLMLHGTLDRSVYYSEAKYILRGLPHAQLLSFEGIGHMWYDYFDVQYWTTLLNRFLSDQEVASLVPPAQPSLAKL
ncbi:alpha/beta fold hydrolase [Rhodotorula paludigena]|uniref:alpha/beta fold hydrolase n=1 Tax=Rhodotorula paludigena TaxID=86838 RepID=UPI0031811854